jgi:hypothetical protein
MACLGNSGRRAIPRRRRNTRAAQPDHDLLPSWKLDAKGLLEIKVPTVQTNMIFPSVSGHGRTGLEQVPWVLKTAKLPLQLLPPHHQLLTHFSIHLTPGSPLIIMVQASTWLVALGASSCPAHPLYQRSGEWDSLPLYTAQSNGEVPWRKGRNRFT